MNGIHEFSIQYFADIVPDIVLRNYIISYFEDRGLTSIDSPKLPLHAGDPHRKTVLYQLSTEDAILHELTGNDELRKHILGCLSRRGDMSLLISGIMEANLIIE